MGSCVSQPPEEQPAAKAAKAPDKRMADEINNKLLAWVKEGPKVRGVQSLIDLAKTAVLNHVSVEDIEKLPILSEPVKGYLRPSFDTEAAQDKVDFSNNNQTIAYQGKGYSTSLIKTPAISSGRFAFSVFVDLSRIRSWMQIGIVSRTRKLKGCPQVFDGTPHPFREGELALRSDGAILTGKAGGGNDGPDMNRQERAYDTGDIIAVQVDMQERMVEWFKNGQSVKQSPMEDGPVYPSVSLDNPKEQVTLLAFFGPLSR